MRPEPGVGGTVRGSSIHPSCLPAPQESISDFYWYYSGKDVIDEQGKRNFSKAMSVAKQVFNSLTEYIQVGPGLGNLRRQGCSHPAPPPPPPPAGASFHLLSSGTLHWKPAESGAQPPLGCRGGVSARVCPHDDEAGSGLSSSVIGHPLLSHATRVGSLELVCSRQAHCPTHGQAPFWIGPLHASSSTSTNRLISHLHFHWFDLDPRPLLPRSLL